MLAPTMRPLALALAPSGLAWRVALVVAGSALIAVCAQLAVTLPGSPVPVTGQTFAVLLVGAALGARLGASAVLAYLVEGALGLPVWAPSATLPPGIARLAGPSGGYLVGFVVAAFIVGLLAERGWDRRVWTAALAMLLGEIAIYVIALPWLALQVPALGLKIPAVLAAGLYPFVAGDLYKLILAALALPAAWRVVRR